MNSRYRRAIQQVPLAVYLILVAAAACSRPTDEGSADRQRKAEPPSMPAPAPAADHRSKVVVLGDSLTAGLGLASADAFPAVLQRKIDAAQLPFEVVNAGVSGDTSAGGLRRLDWSLQDDPRVLIVALGANDGLRGLPVREMKKNLATIIEAAQARKVTVILAGMEAPPNYGTEYAAAFRQAYRDLAAQYHVAFVPFLLDRVAGQAALNQADGVHPTVRGAQIVADTVWAALKPELERLSSS
jgi:acyl-CoA thioesterase I